MKKALFQLFLATVISLFCTCEKEPAAAHAGPQVRRAAAPSITGMVVKPSAFDRSVTVSGTLRPFEETVLMPEVSGRVVSVNLPEGTPVKKGTVLVKLFDEDLQAQLRKVQAQLEIAKLTQARLAELLKISGVSRAEYDNAALNVNALLADAELLSVQIRKTEIRAPFDGRLGLKNVSIGAQITPSTPVVSIRNVDKMKIDFSVPEKYSPHISAGMRLTFEVGGDTVQHAAVVLATEEGIETATRNLRVRAVVENPAATHKPGAFAKVRLALGGGSALMIPTHAIIPDERSKQVVVARSGRAQFVAITTGMRRDSDVEVVMGLAAGDTIVTAGLLFIKPGSELKFSKVVN